VKAGAVVPDARDGLRPGRLLSCGSAGEQKAEPKEGENCSHDVPRRKVGKWTM